LVTVLAAPVNHALIEAGVGAAEYYLEARASFPGRFIFAVAAIHSEHHQNPKDEKVRDRRDS